MNYEISERFAAMWRKVRHDANMSQAQAAKCAGVSKKTIQNWEDGTASPSLIKASEYGAELGINLFPYYVEVFYPEVMSKPQEKMTDAEVEQALFRILKDLPPAAKRKLLFLIVGKHGSSPFGLLERAIAYVQLVLRERVSSTFSIMSSYKTAEVADMLNCPNGPRPDMDVLRMSLAAGMKAVMKGQNSYFDDILEMKDGDNE